MPGVTPISAPQCEQSQSLTGSDQTVTLGRLPAFMVKYEVRSVHG